MTISLIKGHWYLQERLFTDNGIKVWKAHGADGEDVIIKFEPVGNRSTYSLLKECNKMERIYECATRQLDLEHYEIPLLMPFDFGKHDEKNFLALGPYEESLLEKQYRNSQRRFKYKAVYEVAHQIVFALEVVHKTGFVHMDVKLQNMVFHSITVYLTSFRLSIRYRNESNNRFLEQERSNFMIGESDYASWNILHHNTPGPKDDLESLGYCMIKMLTGNFPWTSDNMVDMKHLRNRDEICRGLGAVRWFFYIVDGIQWGQMPPYDRLRHILTLAIERHGGSVGDPIDWTSPSNISEGFYQA